MNGDVARRAAAEGAGTALLLAAIVGSGIMGERLAGGNAALALLANSFATACVLFTLILVFAPVSGAHFNPLVTAQALARRELSFAAAGAFVLAQFVGAITGVALAHAMFELPVLTASTQLRTGTGQWIAEGIATFGLLLTIMATRRAGVPAIAAAVAAWIAGAYWFTASTSFANPIVTLARAFTATFSGIAPADVAPFIAAQVAGAACAGAFAFAVRLR